MTHSQRSANSSNQEILFLGDSLTEGFRLKKEESYPYRFQTWLKENRLDYTVINGGVSGDTTADALFRLDPILQSYDNIQILYIFLGANDFFQGTPPSEIRYNLVEIIHRARAYNPEIQIYLVKFPTLSSMIPGHGEAVSQAFVLAAEDTGVHLVEFPMEGVFQNPRYSLEDGIHPSSEGMKLVSEQVIETFQKRNILRPDE